MKGKTSRTLSSSSTCQGGLAPPWIPVFFKGGKGVGAKSVQTWYSLPR